MTDIRIFVLIAELETQVVDNVSDVLNDVSALGQVTLNSLTAQLLEANDVFGMGSGGKARQDALLSEEQRPAGNGHDGAPEKLLFSDFPKVTQ